MPRVDSPVPLALAIRQQMAEQNLTLRSLAARTRELDPRGKGLSHTYIGQITRGDEPGTWVMEILAAALQLDIEQLAEHRLARARSRLDPHVVGYDEALKALARFEAAVGAPDGETGPPARAPVPDSLKRRAAGGSPTPGDQPAARATRAARSSRRAP